MDTQRRALREQTAAKGDGGVDAMIARAERAPAATPDDASAVVARAKTGDPHAREQLIERFLPYVNSLARGFAADGLEHTDLVQEGCAGLLRALATYEPERGVPFAAYATWWIRYALQEARSDFMRPLRLPPKALRQLAQLKSEHQRVYADEQRELDTSDLARRTGIPLGQVEALLAADARPRSLDEPAGTEGQVGALGDLLEDPLSADAYEEVLDAIAGEQLRSLLGRLTEQERDVVNARFGFDRRPEKLAEVGERLGVSAERVRQIEQRALAKLRKSV